MAKDPQKYVCQLDGCGYGSEVTAFWKLGKGASLPFTGGVIGSSYGEHHSLNLCRRHRIEAVAMDSRPYKVVTTAWARDPGKFDLTVSEAGDLLVPGVAAAAKQGSGKVA